MWKKKMMYDQNGNINVDTESKKEILELKIIITEMKNLQEGFQRAYLSRLKDQWT
jgi:hypothetical protein